MTTKLSNGTRVLIRPIRPDDKQLLVAGLERLSPETIYRRFLAPKPQFSNGELRYLTELDGRNHVAFVAVLADDPAFLVAVARFVRLNEDPEVAEAAIVVADPLQRKGLGRMLALRLADAARALGIRRFQATILGNNVAAQRLLSTMTERLDAAPLSGAVRELSIELPDAA